MTTTSIIPRTSEGPPPEYHAAARASNPAATFHGVMTQATRYLQIRLQKMPTVGWRPGVVTVTPRDLDRSSPVKLMEWLCHRYGLGT